MTEAVQKKTAAPWLSADGVDLDRYIPEELRNLDDLQTEIPRLAKDSQAVQAIEAAIQRVPTEHHLYLGDSRWMFGLSPESVHLVVTSPPYWTLKEYRDSGGQMGHIEDYVLFLDELDRVWQQCYRALVPGGRLICVVGDVCL